MDQKFTTCKSDAFTNRLASSTDSQRIVKKKTFCFLMHLKFTMENCNVTFTYYTRLNLSMKCQQLNKTANTSEQHYRHHSQPVVVNARVVVYWWKSKSKSVKLVLLRPTCIFECTITKVIYKIMNIVVGCWSFLGSARCLLLWPLLFSSFFVYY